MLKLIYFFLSLPILCYGSSLRDKEEEAQPRIPTEREIMVGSQTFPSRIGALFCSYWNQTELPASLGNLRQLTYLTIFKKGVSGKIPTTLGNLTQLQLLNLSDNNLSGSIPSSFKLLVHLTKLNLSKNTLSGSIPDIFENFLNLEKLDLSYNELSGYIPESITSLVSIEELSLSHNQLEGEIPLGFGNLKKLSVFSASHNTLTGIYAQDLESFSERSGRLNLENNQLVLLGLSEEKKAITIANPKSFLFLGIGGEPIHAQTITRIKVIFNDDIQGPSPVVKFNISKVEAHSPLSSLALQDLTLYMRNEQIIFAGKDAFSFCYNDIREHQKAIDYILSAGKGQRMKSPRAVL